MIAILKDFLMQLALIAILLFSYHFFFAQRSVKHPYEKFILTVLFGLSVLLCMSFPDIFASDYRVDIRIVPVLIGTLYAGWEAGLVLAAIIVVYRSLIGIDLGLLTTTLALLISMPVIVYFQKAFESAKKNKRIQIALALLIFYSVVGMSIVCVVRGISWLSELKIHAIHIVINIIAVLFFTSLNEMIRDMSSKNKQLQDDVKDAEIAFLRSQIKPHFLYNTLNSIAALCAKDPDKAEELTLDFAQYLRRSFDFKQLDTMSTLEDELELVQAYLNIEKVRFGAKLHAEYEVDANLDIRIPPMILQPLVENAVRHGLMSKLTGGTIKISIKRLADATVRLEVEDNGCGMSEGKLAEIYQLNDNGKGVGLRNIIQRIKLLYGTSVHIESAEGTGTKIYFNLPVQAGQAWNGG